MSHSPHPERETALYTPYFCEENVYQLLRDPFFAERRAYALFITNAAAQVAMLGQRAGRGEPVVWDYHVIALSFDGHRRMVWDLDSALPFPCDARRSLGSSFPAEIPARFRPRFKCVLRSELLTHFASDRRHMRDAEGRFVAPPPPWPPIQPDTESEAQKAQRARHNLGNFLDMENEARGSVLSLPELLRWLDREAL